MKRIKIKELLNKDEPISDVTIMGWIRFKRTSKKFMFIALNDGSCLSNIQIIIDASTDNFNTLKKLGVGTSVSIQGTLVESPAKGQKWEIQAKSLEILGEAPSDYPLQKKYHSFEFLRTIAHLRPRTNTFGAVFRIRNVAAFAIHEFFFKRGFVYIHTPIITGSDCEGAGDMFRVTSFNLDEIPRDNSGKVDFSKDFFGKETHLTVSGQLEAEVFAMSLGEVYTFGPTFRSENSNTSRHASEFWMIEPEMAFYDLSDTIELAREFLQFVTKSVLDKCMDDLLFLDQRIEKGLIQRLENIVSTPFETFTYTTAIEILEKADRKFEFPVKWGIDLQSEHERYLTEEIVKKPLFLIDYPKEIKAFYMRNNEDNKTVAAMDLLVPKIGEIIGGSQREERLAFLERRIKELNLSQEDYWWYLDLRRYGATPHSGFGLGFERALMYLTGMTNIRDVIPFPRTPGNLEF